MIFRCGHSCQPHHGAGSRTRSAVSAWRAWPDLTLRGGKSPPNLKTNPPRGRSVPGGASASTVSHMEDRMTNIMRKSAFRLARGHRREAPKSRAESNSHSMGGAQQPIRTWVGQAMHVVARSTPLTCQRRPILIAAAKEPIQLTVPMSFTPAIIGRGSPRAVPQVGQGVAATGEFGRTGQVRPAIADEPPSLLDIVDIAEHISSLVSGCWPGGGCRARSRGCASPRKARWVAPDAWRRACPVRGGLADVNRYVMPGNSRVLLHTVM